MADPVVTHPASTTTNAPHRSIVVLELPKRRPRRHALLASGNMPAPAGRTQGVSRALAVLLVVLSACTPHPAKAPPIDRGTDAGWPPVGVTPPPPASPTTTATDTRSAVAPVDDLAWLDRHAHAERANGRGPIRVTGYSRVVSTGMNDPAHIVGFTRDGSQFGYCALSGGTDPQLLSCELVDRQGHMVRSSDDGPASKHAEMIRWLSDVGMPELPKGKDGMPIAPELGGDWDFAASIVLAVVEGGSTQSGAFVRLGGSVDGEAPVFTTTLSVHQPGMLFHTSWINGLVLSPDGGEIGLVAGFFCMEWCNEFVVRRMATRTLASRIFNDTGMRHHAKGDYAASAALFARALQADRGNALAAYNLACALARLDDADAERALAYAIALGGEAVRPRASRDDDFGGVLSSPWFQRLVSP
jgi:hypothetical protein